jgi:hypothetical protein
VLSIGTRVETPDGRGVIRGVIRGRTRWAFGHRVHPIDWIAVELDDGSGRRAFTPAVLRPVDQGR